MCTCTSRCHKARWLQLRRFLRLQLRRCRWRRRPPPDIAPASGGPSASGQSEWVGRAGRCTQLPIATGPVRGPACSAPAPRVCLRSAPARPACQQRSALGGQIQWDRRWPALPVPTAKSERTKSRSKGCVIGTHSINEVRPSYPKCLATTVWPQQCFVQSPVEKSRSLSAVALRVR